MKRRYQPAIAGARGFRWRWTYRLRHGLFDQMTTPARPPRFVVAAAMKDEGPFIVEWVCWYRMLGFEVLIVTNDCTDHSPALLDALQDAGWLRHAVHSPEAGEPPKRSAHRAIRGHPLVAESDWLLICDVDEFLVLHHADTVADYLAGFDPVPLGIGIHWRCFGTAGVAAWGDGLTHRRFLRAAETGHRVNASFKSLFRRPLAFATFGAHSPRGYSGRWGAQGQVWVDCRGKPLGNFHPNERPQKATAPDRVRHDSAQLNHYALRSTESFSLKRGTPSASALVDRYTPQFFDRYDRNEVQDTSALRFADAFDALHDQAMKLPGVTALHHQCCADYAAHLATKAGLAPVDDPRYRHHLALAQN